MITERRVIAMLAALERMKLYSAAHPGSPSAVRLPRLFKRGRLWLAILGPSAENGIFGAGQTVENALRDFDENYLAALRAPVPKPLPSLKLRRDSRRRDLNP